MNKVVFILNILIVVVVSGGPAWKEVQRGSGIKIGTGSKNATSPRGNGIRVGGSTRGVRITSTSLPEEYVDIVHTSTVATVKQGQHKLLHVGMVVPYKSFGVREYTKAVTSAKHNLQRKLKLFKTHDVQVHIVMKELTPSPTGNDWAELSICYILVIINLSFSS